MRRGEALALRWDDIDLGAKTIRIRGTLGRVDGRLVVSEPKTTKSRRTLRASPAVETALRRQRADLAADRLRTGSEWSETGFVFTTATGAPIDPRNVLRTMNTAANRVGLRGVGVHTLRHSAATALLEDGISIKVVSDMLGHSSIAVTGDVYAHVSDDAAQVAADTLSAALGL